MVSDEEAGRGPSSPLLEALKELARDLGVRREDLRSLLSGDLSELQRYLSTDLTRKPLDVRRELIDGLESYIQRLGKPGGQSSMPVNDRVDWYRGLVRVMLNMLENGDVNHLSRDGRRAVLAEKAGVSPDTIQRRFDEALTKIVSMLEAEKQPPRPTPVKVSQKWFRSTRFRIGAAATVVIVLTVVAVTQSGDNSDKSQGEASQSSTAQESTGKAATSETLRASTTGASDASQKSYSLQVLTDADQIQFAGVMKPRGGYYFNKSITEIPRPISTDCIGNYAWAHGMGGQDLDSTAAQFSIFARDKTIDVLGARIEVVGRLNPTSGVNIPCQQGGPIEVRIIGINLSDSPELTYYPEGVDKAAAPFAFHIKPQDTEVFQFQAITLPGMGMSWRIVLTATVDGNPEDIVVDNNGKPFITYSGANDLPTYIWDRDHWYELS
jgi:hypothetical protein